MKTYISKNDFIEKAKRQIEVYIELISNLQILEKVVYKFDGKVYNKRLETACKKVGFEGALIFYSQYKNNFRHEISLSGRYTNVDSRSAYIDIVLDDEEWKRINAKETIKSIKQEIDRLYQYIGEYRLAIDKIDYIVYETEKIKNEIAKFNKDVPSFARPYFCANDGTEIYDK